MLGISLSTFQAWMTHKIINISMYFPNYSAMNRMWHKVNLDEYNWFECKVFLHLDWLLY